ncbi:MAG TPA: MFS transporter [Myxococcota bacterium]|nr:MFS transporter [Myxococcota bacterium]
MATPVHEPIPRTLPIANGVAEGYRRYVLGLLVVVYILNFVDRQILTILTEDIRKEMALNDTLIGLLTGSAFALFYTFMGIPIARWADRGTRRTIIALALTVWSGMTALTGLAQNFAQLALARIGVGIGEAGGSPPAHSIISDLFPPERRGTALSIYSLGIPIGGGLGALLGGTLGHLYGWRAAFMIVGVPGVLIAALLRATVAEPKREIVGQPGSNESIGEVLRFMGKLPSFRHMALGASMHALYGYGAANWVPAFLIRSHHMSKEQVGRWLFLTSLTLGVLGTFLGGFITDRVSKRDPSWYLRVPAIASGMALPFAFAFYLWNDTLTALLLSVPGLLLGGVYLGPTFAMTQTLVKPQMRALASSILLFIINLIGLGLGPLLVGWISDLLRPSFGEDSLRYALLIVVVGGGSWATLQYVLASRTLAKDLEAKHA